MVDNVFTFTRNGHMVQEDVEDTWRLGVSHSGRPYENEQTD